MLTEQAIERTVARIALMPFFPSSDSGARATIAKEIADMATNDDQVIWLGHRFIQLFPKQWPGLAELRAVFCKRFQPADGVEVHSAVYDEFPTEAQLGPVPDVYLLPSPTEREAIEAAVQAPRLLTGEIGQFSADPEFETLVHEIAAKSTMPAIPTPRSVQEISQMLYSRSVASTDPKPKTTAPGSESDSPNPGSQRWQRDGSQEQRITQADIERELERAGRKKTA